MTGEMKTWRKKKIGDFTEEKEEFLRVCFASHYLFSTFPHARSYEWEEEVLTMTINSDEEGSK